MLTLSRKTAVAAACVLLRRALVPETPGASDLDRLKKAASPELVGLLTAQAVANLAAAALDDAKVAACLDTDFIEFTLYLRDQNGHRNNRLSAQLARVGDELSRAGIKAVALKGAAELLDPAYAFPGDRMMSDLDILVPEARIDDAIAVLKSVGYSDNDAPYDRSRRHAPPLWHSDEAGAVELHTAVSSRCPIAIISAGRVLEFSVPTVCAGMRVPSPADRICHLLAHAQYDTGRYRVRWLLLRDVADLAVLRSRFGDETLQVARDRFRAAGAVNRFDSLLIAGERILRWPETEGVAARDRLWADRTIDRLSKPWLMKKDLFLSSAQRTLARLSSGPAARRQLLSDLADPAKVRRFMRRQRDKFGSV